MPRLIQRLRLRGVPPAAAFLALLALFLVLRVTLSLGMVGSMEGSEEGFTMAAAWELLHHPVWDVRSYQYTSWEGGSLVAVLLATPLCALLGPSLLALKLTALALSSVTLLGIFLLCREAFGQRVAVIACLLYIFFPRPIFSYSLTAKGFHPDAMALQTLFLWMLFRCRRQTARARHWFLLGLLACLSVYFAFISALTVGAAAAALGYQLLRRAGAPRPAYAPLALGALLGAVPLLLSQALSPEGGFRTYHGGALSYLLPASLGERWALFTSQTLPMMLRFSYVTPEIPPWQRVRDLLYWGLCLSALLGPFLLRAARRGPRDDAPTRLYMLLAATLLGATLWTFFASGHPVFNAHLVPLLLVLLICLAVRMGQAWATRPGRWGVALLLAAHVASGLNIHGVDLNLRGPHSVYLDGRNYPAFLVRQGFVYRKRASPRFDAVYQLTLSMPYLVATHDFFPFPTLLGPLNEGLRQGRDPLQVVQQFLAQNLVTDLPVRLAECAGVLAGHLLDQGRVTAPALAAFLARQPSTVQQGMLGTLGYLIRRLRREQPLRGELARAGLAPGWQEALYLGMGRADTSLLNPRVRRPWAPDGEIRQHLASYARGMGRGLAASMIREVPAFYAEPLDPALRVHFWRGVREQRREHPYRMPRSVFIDGRPPAAAR